jgi:hypothetical protein
VKGLLFKKACPRCKRRYPQNFTACLECGATLVDTQKEAKKAEIRKYLPIMGMVVVCGAIIAAVLFFILPLVQYSLSSGQEFGTASGTRGTFTVVAHSLNQPAADGNLQVAMVKTRDGAKSANSKKFLFVTTNLKNLRSDKPVHVAASDFTLVDAADQQYLSYAIGDKIAQDLSPLGSASYDLVYEVPEAANSLKIWYTFPASSDASAKSVVFLL